MVCIFYICNFTKKFIREFCHDVKFQNVTITICWSDAQSKEFWMQRRWLLQVQWLLLVVSISAMWNTTFHEYGQSLLKQQQHPSLQHQDSWFSLISNLCSYMFTCRNLQRVFTSVRLLVATLRFSADTCSSTWHYKTGWDMIKFIIQFNVHDTLIQFPDLHC